MSPTKHAQPKNKIAPAIEEETPAIDPKKLKKGGEIELPEEPIAIDEKVLDEELPIAEDVDDAEGSEIGLDDEEINPFGDKWEQ